MRDGFPASHCIYSEGEKTFFFSSANVFIQKGKKLSFSPLQIFAFYYISQTDILVHLPLKRLSIWDNDMDFPMLSMWHTLACFAINTV